MKKILLIVLALFYMMPTQAKKVKLSVNMKGQSLSPNGIHVAGDFQTLAGYPGGDWNSATTSMQRESLDTNIYSVVLDIPAHRKYEYKFVNGDLFYEVEFVPDESRVAYDFSDNRWFYLDSLNADTTFFGAIMFAGNSPEGLKLLRLKVDMKKVGTVNPNGVFVGGSFNNYNYSLAKMYSFTGTAYEYFTFIKEGDSVYYHFSNGNVSAGKETVPSNCALNQHRYALLNADLVLDSVCFSSCALCTTTAGTNEINQLANAFKVFPNPANGYVVINANNNQTMDAIEILDLNGQLLAKPVIQKHSQTLIVDLPFSDGIYFVKVYSGDQIFVQKIVLNH